MNRHPNGDIGLIEEFRGSFPLFERIAGHFGDDTPKERVPWFYAYLLAAASNQEPGACCFVLDKTAGTAPIAAILMALSRLRADFPSLVRNYADNAFSPGQRVKVRPNDYVFEYEGPWEGVPGFFRLKLLNEDAWRSFPLAEVLRLEPTDRVQPKGHGNTELGKYESSPLDQLLELTTCGNNSILKHSLDCIIGLFFSVSVLPNLSVVRQTPSSQEMRPPLTSRQMIPWPGMMMTKSISP